MDRQEYETLNAVAVRAPKIDAAMLKNQSDRTLIWGYTCDRQSFHVYLKDGVITRAVYMNSYPQDLWDVRTDLTDPADFVPNKRAYPEACDSEFCALLKTHGAHISFTNWDEKRQKAQFYGAIADVRPMLTM